MSRYALPLRKLAGLYHWLKDSTILRPQLYQRGAYMLQRVKIGLFGVAILGMAFVSARSATAQIEDYSRVVVFGDSLSDTGNLFLSVGPNAFPFGGTNPPPLFPADDYAFGRFSNGPIWLEYLAPNLGVAPPAPFVIGGTNYAFGGAETGFGISARLTPNVGEQLGIYAVSQPPLSDSDLVVLWIGGNDFSPIPPATLPTSDSIVANVAAHIVQLEQLGARNILVPNLPPLGDTPQGAEQGPILQLLLNLVVLDYNLKLEAALSELEDSLDLNIVRFNTWGLVKGITADPPRFGFTNVTEAAYDLATRTQVSNANEYLYWDTIHPTTAAHQVLGRVGGSAILLDSLRDALDPDNPDRIRIKGFLSSIKRSLLIGRIDFAKLLIENGNFEGGIDSLLANRSDIQRWKRWRLISTNDAAAMTVQIDRIVASLTL